MSKYKILVVEDDVAILGLIKLYLESRLFIVFTANSGEKALHLVKDENLDLILLDIEMPGMNGFEVCKSIREMVNTPIIFVSSRRGVRDKVKSFELGGDDYLTKPFDFTELEARIKANIRRFKEEKLEQKHTLYFQPLEINLNNYTCYVDGVQINLSSREMQILIALAQNPTQVWSAEKLYNHIWGFESFGDIQTIKVHISNLRKKLNEHIPNSNYIKTVRGFGYKFIS